MEVHDVLRPGQPRDDEAVGPVSGAVLTVDHVDVVPAYVRDDAEDVADHRDERPNRRDELPERPRPPQRPELRWSQRHLCRAGQHIEHRRAVRPIRLRCGQPVVEHVNTDSVAVEEPHQVGVHRDRGRAGRLRHDEENVQLSAELLGSVVLDRFALHLPSRFVGADQVPQARCRYRSGGAGLRLD